MLLTVTLSLLEGLGTTMELFALTLMLALPLGLVIALGAMSRLRPLRWLVSTVVWVVRGTPLMIQILIIFYGPGLLFDLPLPWWLMTLRFAMPWRWLPRKPSPLSRGARLRLALQDLGPIFIKFGQLLSTRRDLLPADITGTEIYRFP